MIDLGEALAIHGERRAGRHAARFRRAHDQRTEPPHLLLQEADGVIELVAAERVAADELGEAVGLVHGGRRTGRISYSVTGTPREAACQAASDPARPPPMMRTPSVDALADRRFGAAAASTPWPRLDVASPPLPAWRPSRVAPPFGAPLPGCRRCGDAPAAPRRPRLGAAAARRAAPRAAPARPRASASPDRRPRDRRVDLAVGHVGTVAAFEHLERRAAVGHLDLPDHPLGRLTRRDRFGAASSASARSRSTVKRSSVGFERSVVVAVLDVRTEPAKAGDDRLRRFRMRRPSSRGSSQQLQRFVERDRRFGHAAGQRRALRAFPSTPFSGVSPSCT